MFRRSRFSVRPNVGTVGRTAAGTPQETPAASQETSQTQKEPNESNNASLASNSDVTPSEKAPSTGDGNDQNGEGSSSSASVQRRKRFSIKPKVAPGRPLAISRTPKSPIKAVTAPSGDGVCGSDLEKPLTSSQPAKTAAPRGLQSPRRRRLSEDAKQHKIQSKVGPVSSEKPGPSSDSPSEDSPKPTHLPADRSKQLENTSTSQAKEVHSRAHDRVPPSIPDKEATEISEKAKTLISSKNVTSMTPSVMSLSRLLNDPSDVQRMLKAQRLRELLRQERCKETNLKRAKVRRKEYILDPTKMTMRDLIHYLPESNPMRSSLEEHHEETETMIPPSPRREEPTERPPVPEVTPAKVNTREEEVEEEEEDAAAEEDQEESVMVPQLKVAEDGSLIIDEESLTVEVQRAKGPNPASDRDPIFERGSTTTYASFRKSNYSKPWSIEETDMFYLAVSMVGTDFSMICQLFPHRARSEIKNKFKKEERQNSWRIDKAFRERRKLDIEYFSKLLEKIMEFQREKKKLKSLVGKNNKRKARTRPKGKKSAKSLSDMEEEEQEEKEEDDEIPDLEKENEDQCNEGETPASEPKKKRKRKNGEASPEETNEKKNKTGDVPEDSEPALPESHTDSEMTPNVNTTKDPVIHPAKLSRAGAPKPLLPLGLMRGKKGKSEETQSDKGDKNASEEQVNKNESNARKTSREKFSGDDISSEEEEETVKHQGPTRYGRIPKPNLAFAYPSKDELHSSETETSSASKSKAKGALKRGKSLKPQSDQKPKKSKLVTLRSSKPDFSDDEDEEDAGCSSGKGIMSSGLHSLNAVISEVDDPMAELDILASMPDMLGISQDALCPDSSCHQTQYETSTAETCDHQLDLLVDVIDIITSEQTELSQDDSYNEAAQTLLTIGKVSHVSMSTQGEVTTQASTSGMATDGEKSDHLDEQIVADAQPQSPLSAACSQTGGEISETVASVDSGNLEMSHSDIFHVKTIEPTCDELKTAQSSNGNSPSTKVARFSKVKPKPNLGRSSRTAPPTIQMEISKKMEAEERHSVLAVEASPKRADSNEALLEDGDSPKDVQLTEEKSGSSSITQGCSMSLSQVECSGNEVPRGTNSPNRKDVSVAPHDRTVESDLSSSLESKSELTHIVPEPCTPSDSIQDSSSKHLPAEKDLPENQKSMGVSAPRRSRLSKIKPNLPQMSRTAMNKSQISKETVKTDPLTTSNSESQKQTILDVETQSTSFLSRNVDVSPQAECQNTLQVLSSPETQAEYKSNVELAAAPEHSCSPATSVSPIENKPANKQESNVTSAQLRRSNLQKVKPKPNLTQTSRGKITKPQATEDTAMKSSIESTRIHLEDTDCASRLDPILASDSIHESTAKQVTNKPAPTEVVIHVDREHRPVDQGQKQTSIESCSTFKSTDKASDSLDETSEISCSSAMTSHVSRTNFDSDQDRCGQSAVSVRPEEESAVCKPDGENTTSEQLRRNRISKIRLRPNISQASRASKLKPRTSESQSEKHANPEPDPDPTCGPSLDKQSENNNLVMELTPPVTSQSSEMKKTLSEAKKQNFDANPQSTSSENLMGATSSTFSNKNPTVKEPQFGQGSNLNSGADLERSNFSACFAPSKELQVNQKEDKVPSAQLVKRSRSQKPKPNLSQTSRPVRSKADDKSEVQPQLGAQQTIAKKEKYSEFTDANLTAQGGPSESMNVSQTIKSAITSNSKIFSSARDQTEPCAASASDQTGDKLNTGNSTTTQAVRRPQSPASEQNRETEEKVLTNVEVSSLAVTEKTTPQRRQRFSKVKPKPNLEKTCRVAVRSLQSDDHSRPLEDQSKGMSSVALEQPLESTKDKMSDKDPANSDCLPSGDCNLAVKPKPSLRCSGRLRQTQPAENTKPTETDSDSTSQAFGASREIKKSVRELKADDPEKGVIEKSSEKDSSSIDSRSSHSCVKPQSSYGHETSRAEAIQRDPLLSQILPEQVPSDPDEPFFILSLTEIPVPSAGEVGVSGAQNLSYCPAAGASGQQPSVSEVSLKAEENHPKVSVEPKVFKNSIAGPNEKAGDDLGDKETLLSRKAKVSEASVAETRSSKCRKAASKRNQKKTPTKAEQTSSKPTASASNSNIPSQTAAAADCAHIGLRSTALTSPERESGFVDNEPTSVSQYFLSDIFTEVDEG
ncbi:transcription factor TFIIIB component B'' homolog isoform X1 [Xiphophorus couchianus]|uniref:transcription factor TFIIIB component B'' homolog isoform X1 n=1 Tax=Xiphophorus couchianus TaxID=32473 RepID=UPI001017040F|nr:transcription factor TFIIIB component B'' homolog isoform X1 [Xiphophorus couchianus]XP_027881111.1 transcription factor TFIIIB component B'' homolog isoform X1 [Xiphophorus couchianus]XP_027881112.1 transcription factor TFIIIB component B'' homolog isoform X1 [Xiphophorus couchianus]